MTDLVGWTYDAATHRSAVSILASVALGVVSGLGPCALARGTAIAALTQGTSRRNLVLVVCAYACGTGVGYVAFGTIAGFALRAAAWSSYSYAVLATVLACTGIATIARAPSHHHQARMTSIGGASLVGLGASLTLSPCCTPFVVALTAAAFGDARFAGLLLCGFTIGHVAPAAAMAAMAGVGRGAARLRPAFVAFASGTIALTMAAYYGLLV